MNVKYIWLLKWLINMIKFILSFIFKLEWMLNILNLYWDYLEVLQKEVCISQKCKIWVLRNFKLSREEVEWETANVEKI